MSSKIVEITFLTPVTIRLTPRAFEEVQDATGHGVPVEELIADVLDWWSRGITPRTKTERELAAARKTIARARA